MILVLTEHDDEHADHLVPRLKSRGATVARLAPSEFPQDVVATIRLGTAEMPGYLVEAQGMHLDLQEVTTIWCRRPAAPRPYGLIDDPAVKAAVRKDCSDFVRDLWLSLDCRWCPATLPALQFAQLKARQLRVAQTLGLEVPATVVTNDPRELLDFYRRQGGRIVSKLVGPLTQQALLPRFYRYCEPVTSRDIAYASDVRHSPMIFQAEVPKALELRVTIVGDRVFAAEIHSQATHHTRADWRRYDKAHTLHRPHDLPASVARLCVRLLRRLALNYGAIDMVLTPDGRYVFLELNPAGQYLWIEQMTGLPITEALCDLLLSPESRPDREENRA